MALICLRPPSVAMENIEQIHLFDLDRTLAECNASLLFAHYLLDKKVISNRAWFRCWVGFFLNKAGLKSLESQISVVFNAFFKGVLFEPIHREVMPFWQQVLQAKLRPSLLQQIEKNRQKGHPSAIFSASPDFLVQCVAKQLDINFMLATEFRYDDSGQYFDSLGQIAGGRAKAQAVGRLRSRYEKAKIHSYSDSREDIPFLEASDQAWLVAPDKRLKRWAALNPQAKIWPLEG